MLGGGGAASSRNITFFNLAFTGGVAVACNCAVNCVYMISGYYISGDETSENFKKRIKRVWIPTAIYSISIH